MVGNIVAAEVFISHIGHMYFHDKMFLWMCCCLPVSCEPVGILVDYVSEGYDPC